MKTLLATILAMAMATAAAAAAADINCPDDSIRWMFNEPDYGFSATYTCTTDGVTEDSYFALVPTGTPMAEVFKKMLGLDSVEAVVEELTGQKCIALHRPESGELLRLICRPTE